MKHPYAQFGDNTSMLYIDNPYFRKSLRIDEYFSVGQRFSAKFKLKLKIAYFHIQRNI
jgi:hypothetical protein